LDPLPLEIIGGRGARRIAENLSEFSFQFAALRLIDPYENIMKTAKTGRPNGYSGFDSLHGFI